MKKIDYINKLKEHEKSHVRWYTAAEALILDVKTDSCNIPKSYTDCNLGEWLYSEGYSLHAFDNFKEIEDVHIELHRLYMKIYKEKQIYVHKNVKNLKRYQKSQEINLQQLKVVSRVLISKIEFFINELNQMHDKSFKENLK